MLLVQILPVKIMGLRVMEIFPAMVRINQEIKMFEDISAIVAGKLFAIVQTLSIINFGKMNLPLIQL